MLGFVQGRLTKFKNKNLQIFPKNKWKQEIYKAKKINIDFIEYFAEREGDLIHNPFFDNKKFKQLKLLSERNLKSNYSFCDDYYINNSFLDSNNFLRVENIFNKCNQLNIKVYVLPLLEKSNITSNNYFKYVKKIKEICKLANKNNIIIALESNVDKINLLKLVKLVKNASFKIVYDTGNRVLIDKNQNEAIRLLKNYIVHIHIKDKDVNGNNVYLGTGLVNFSEIFKTLKKINYKKNYVFECLRGNDPIRTMKYNIDFVNFYLKEHKL